MKFPAVREYLWNVRNVRKSPQLLIKISLLFSVPLGMVYVIFSINHMEKLKYDYLSDNEEYESAELPVFEFSNVGMFKGQKVIHIDLKGAPPKIDYLLKFIQFLSNQGATGILVEYEDMFPYYGEIENISALNAYTSSDIAAIIDVAADNNLTLIPLIPTFNHLEFVLKLEQYKHLREVENNPQVLCYGQRQVYSILKKMIDQILSAHATSEYLHIGGDDTELVGVCSKCRKLLREKKWRKDHIYFEHLKEIAEYITKNYPSVRPIVWSNNFLSKNEQIILLNQIPEMVEVMLGYYKPERSLFPLSNDMYMISKLFKSVWIANAFKGTPKSTYIVTNAEYHLRNSREWMEFVEDWKNLTTFKGIVLMGSQRFNHFSTLSELLPVGIPSVSLNLQFLNLHSTSVLNFELVKESLNCSHPILSNLHEIENLKLVSSLKCGFPGFKVYHFIHILYNVLINLKSSLEKMQTPDFTFYAIVHNTSNPSYVHGLNLTVYKRKLLELDDLKNEIRHAMYEIYDEYTIGEWITTHIVPVQMRLKAAINTMEAIRDLKKVWPRRPFVHSDWKIKKMFNKVCTEGDILGCTVFNIL